MRARVRGVVQGVGYRASTERRARQLGLSGWVRNERDGSVVLEAQGPTHAVTELEAWLRLGPPMAEVEGVEAEELAVVEGERGFGVRY